MTVKTSAGATSCECGKSLADCDVTGRHGSPYGTIYATAMCECGLFHYVEVDQGGD
jgi:hypothetical protein